MLKQVRGIEHPYLLRLYFKEIRCFRLVSVDAWHDPVNLGVVKPCFAVPVQEHGETDLRGVRRHSAVHRPVYPL